MFKTTTHFFKKVYQKKVTEIEIDNYIETVTKGYNLKKLKIFHADLEKFTELKIYEIEEKITREKIANTIVFNRKIGIEIPYKKVLNEEYLFAEHFNKPLAGIPQYKKVLDKEKLIYPHEFSTIKKLKHKIASLIFTKIQELESLKQNEDLKKTNDVKDEDTHKTLETITKNKSLILNGKPLNLSERFKIANKAFGIASNLRDLNIGDLEKYQLLAYTLGCDKDNARKLINGTYNSKDEDRDLTDYYKSLGLNE